MVIERRLSKTKPLKVILNPSFISYFENEEYEILGKRLPVQFDFVNKSVKYDINKKIIRDIYSYGSKSDIDVLESIVTKKPAKLNVTITSAS